MENSLAEMICLLKINTQCDGCKMKVMQVLRNINGVYNITIDGERGTVRVTGRVNPSTILGLLEKYGKHAEVKYIKFDGEILDRRTLPYYYGGRGGNGGGDFYAPYSMGSSYPMSTYPPHLCYQASLPLPLPPPPSPPQYHPQLVPLYPSPPAPVWPRPYGPPPLTSYWPPPPPFCPRPNKMATEDSCAIM
ncbi:heavy metal-associated isoprenylated plant protein 28-like [Arachis hypogaea]|uniref:heavy metal-associated isoprenylated plant protein 28-like n=1 Tax=Arachis hypogaea TaxID=3818 RepID=UPI003B22038F